MNLGDPAPPPGLEPHSLPQGNRESIWTLWHDNQRHVERVLRASFRLSQWDLDEALSIAMLKFHEQYPKHRHKIRNLQAWLARLARNATTDHLRKEMRLHRRHQESGNLQLLEHLVGPETVTAVPAEERPELPGMTFLRNRLSGKLRETAIAYFVQGKKYREIAGAEQVEASTIRKRIQIVRKKLRAELHKQSVNAQAVPDGRFGPVTSRILPGPPTRHDVFVQVFLHWIPTRGRQRVATLKSYLGRRQPRECSKWLELAELHLAGGCWLEALDCYVACYRKYPSVLEVGWRAAQLHCLLGNQDESELLCREMLASELSPAKTHELKGCLAWIQGDLVAARKAWQSAAVLEPENSTYLVHLFHACMARGRVHEARDSLARVLALDPHHYQAISLLLPMLHANGEHGLLQQHAASLYSRGSRNAMVVKYYADFRLQQDLTPQEFDSLRRMMSSALATAPGFTGLLDTRARYLTVMDQPQRLLRFLDSIVHLHPGSAGAWKVRAIWMCHLGRTKEAVIAIRRACALAPRDHAVLAAAAYVAACYRLKDLWLELLDPQTKAEAGAHPRLLLSAAIAWSAVAGDTRRSLDLAQRAAKTGSADPLVVYAHGRLLAEAGASREALVAFQPAWAMVHPVAGHILIPHLQREISAALLACGELSQARQWRNSPGNAPGSLNSFAAPACNPAELGLPFKLPELLLFFARCGDSRPDFIISV
jgi:RNA polymerase sigma factor (sigma-70 family)